MAATSRPQSAGFAQYRANPVAVGMRNQTPSRRFVAIRNRVRTRRVDIYICCRFAPLTASVSAPPSPSSRLSSVLSALLSSCIFHPCNPRSAVRAWMSDMSSTTVSKPEWSSSPRPLTIAVLKSSKTSLVTGRGTPKSLLVFWMMLRSL